MGKYIVLHLESFMELEEAKVALSDVPNLIAISKKRMSMSFHFSSQNEKEQIENCIAYMLMDFEIYEFLITIENSPENEVQLINIPINRD